MVNGLSDLLKACAAPKQSSPGEMIADGEVSWFVGYPAPAPEGMVALYQTEALTLLFREQDVREVHRWGERYVIRVGGSANMLVRFEQVVKAGASCGCGNGKKGNKPGVTARLAEGAVIDPDFDVNLINIGGCVFTIECYTVPIPIRGPVRLCIPTGLHCV